MYKHKNEQWDSCHFLPVYIVLIYRTALPHQYSSAPYSPTKCPSVNLFLDDCQSLNPNSSKTEFILIGLKMQLDKITYTTPHLTSLTLLTTLASSLMNTYLFRPNCCHLQSLLSPY